MKNMKKLLLKSLILLISITWFAHTTSLYANTTGEKVGHLGVYIAKVDDTLRSQLKLPRGVGLTVQNVSKDSPAQKAGLKTHDILIKFNDQLLFNGEQFTELVRAKKAGDHASVEIMRQGASQIIEVTLGEMDLPDEPLTWTPQAPANIKDSIDKRIKDIFITRPDLKVFPFSVMQKKVTFLGVEAKAVDDSLMAQLGLGNNEGVLVGHVVETSPAEKAGIKEHDIITRFNGKTVKGTADFIEMIHKCSSNDTVEMEIIRGGKTVTLKAILSETTPPAADYLKNLPKMERIIPHIEFKTDSKNKGQTVMVMENSKDESENADKSDKKSTVKTDKQTMVTSHITISSDSGSKQNKVLNIKTQEGEINLKEEDGKRHVIATDPKGTVLFDGPINTEEERAKLPPDIKKRIESIEKNLKKATPSSPAKELKIISYPTHNQPI
jgi:membrane-associated protease RseP (regulator of RpoE activity)